MSAFVVSSQTMHNAVAGIYDRDGGLAAATVLGRKLFAMNYEAVMQRYPDCTPDNMHGPCDQSDIGQDYRYNPTFASACKVVQYKAASCLSYQCAEGDVPDSDQYKDLDRAINAMAHDIVSSLPAYRKAKWAA